MENFNLENNSNILEELTLLEERLFSAVSTADADSPTTADGASFVSGECTESMLHE